MVTLDHDKYDVVGIVTRMGLTQNAQIVGIGLSDRETGEYIPVPLGDRNKVFPTRGSVFAFDFLKHNPNMENECICMCVKPNNNTNIINGEDYVWDWKDDVYIYADKVRKLKHPICENGGINYDILSKEGIFNKDGNVYFICADNIYRYSSGSRLLPYWKLSDVEADLYVFNGNTFLMSQDITIAEHGKVDITNDEQLIEWYKKNILKKEWNTIYESKDFKAVDSILTNELKNLKIPANVFKSRLERITSMSENISLTFEELEDLSTSPWFADTISEAIDKYADRYIDKIQEKHAAELAELNATHEKKLRDANSQFEFDKEYYKSQIEEKKTELKTINERIQKEEEEKRKDLEILKAEIFDLDEGIKTRNEEIERLDSRKESIISDFGIIKDVLSVGAPATAVQTKGSVHIEVFDKKDQREFTTASPYRKNIEAYLKIYKAEKLKEDEIITTLMLHNVILFPDDITLLATMQATRRCRYAVEYVGVNWKSFEDLKNNGLSDIVAEAMSNPDVVHFLVLRNINMSFIPCYMQPIIDMQSGLLHYFPGTSIKFPENLRILCTRTKDTVIPVTKEALLGIGCITPCEERHSGSASIAEGYLPAEVFSDLPMDETYVNTDSEEYYIDE